MWCLLCLQSTDSRRAGFSRCSSQALEHRLTNYGTRAYLLCGMWDLPEPGVEPLSPSLAETFFTTEPPGKPQDIFFFFFSRNSETESNNGWYNRPGQDKPRSVRNCSPWNRCMGWVIKVGKCVSELLALCNEEVLSRWSGDPRGHKNVAGEGKALAKASCPLTGRLRVQSMCLWLRRSLRVGKV